jgi:serine/threonine protein kinase
MEIVLPERYRLARVSTGGGMGDIYLCDDLHLKRGVILKMLKEGEEARRLLDEQKALLKLRSKHVVQLYDVIKVMVDSKPQTGLILEHIPGKDLEYATFKPDDGLLKVLWQVACGLLDIHKSNIIHRDIKPNNIRIDSSGVIKILDFGLARNSGVDSKTRSIIGTAGFLAPELWGSSTISFSKAIDIYAFAVMALSLVTKYLPNELLQQPPVPVPRGSVATLLNGLPDDVISMLEACLNYNPGDRPTIDVVEAVLRQHLLFNRHRGLLILSASTYELSAKTPTVVVSSGSTEKLGIKYDGLRFTVTSVTGVVLVNNTPVSIGQELPGCCVIGFGPRNTYRNFVTFDVSNPEVMP